MTKRQPTKHEKEIGTNDQFLMSLPPEARIIALGDVIGWHTEQGGKIAGKTWRQRFPRTAAWLRRNKISPDDVVARSKDWNRNWRSQMQDAVPLTSLGEMRAYLIRPTLHQVLDGIVNAEQLTALANLEESRAISERLDGLQPSRKRKRKKPKRRGRPPADPGRNDAIRASRGNNMSVKEIAKEHDLSERQIRRILNRT